MGAVELIVAVALVVGYARGAVNYHPNPTKEQETTTATATEKADSVNDIDNICGTSMGNDGSIFFSYKPGEDSERMVRVGCHKHASIIQAHSVILQIKRRFIRIKMPARASTASAYPLLRPTR